MARMAKAGFAGRTVTLRLRFGDYSRATRAQTFPDHVATAAPLLAAARTLLTAATPAIEQRGLTCIGVTVTNVVDLGGGTQLELRVVDG